MKRREKKMVVVATVGVSYDRNNYAKKVETMHKI